MSCLLVSGCSSAAHRAQRDLIARPVYHTVKAGDSLASVAGKYGVSEKSLGLLNGIKGTSELVPGRKLLVKYSTEFSSSSEPAPRVKDGIVPLADPGGTGVVTALGWPLVVKGVLTSRFGPRWGRHHDGIDLGSPVGTPILSAHAGRVIYADDKISGYGKMIIVRDSKDGFLTLYAHVRRYLVDMGDKVQRGSPVAELGMTGRTSGPHLHFELRVPVGGQKGSGKYRAVDPLPYLLKSPQPPKG